MPIGSSDSESGKQPSMQDDPQPWFVAYTKARQEGEAQANAERQGFLTYLPMYRIVKQAGATASETAERSEPMFPRYLFIKPSRPGQSVAPLRSTRGIRSLLAFGDELATMPDTHLDSIRRYENWRNCAEPHAISAIQPGQRVRLKNNGLAGLEGLVEEVSSKRVVVLLALLGRRQSIEVRHRQLEIA